MDIQGLVSPTRQPIQVRQVQPGKLEELKKAASENQLDEAIVENDQGTFVVYGKDLHLDYEYADNDGVTHRTLPKGFIGAPQEGEKIFLGDLKGKVAFFDDQTDRLERATQIGIAVGGFTGFVLGATSAKGAESFIGAFLGAGIGSVLGMGISYGATALFARPSFSSASIERFCLPEPSKTLAEAQKIK